MFIYPYKRYLWWWTVNWSHPVHRMLRDPMIFRGPENIVAYWTCIENYTLRSPVVTFQHWLHMFNRKLISVHCMPWNMYDILFVGYCFWANFVGSIRFILSFPRSSGLCHWYGGPHIIEQQQTTVKRQSCAKLLRCGDSIQHYPMPLSLLIKKCRVVLLMYRNMIVFDLYIGRRILSLLLCIHATYDKE